MLANKIHCLCPLIYKLLLGVKYYYESKCFAALRIHVSPEAKVFLDELAGYTLELRGQVHMKVPTESFGFIRHDLILEITATVAATPY